MGTSSYTSSRLIERRSSGASRSSLDAVVALVVAIVATAALVSFRAGLAGDFAASMVRSLVAS
jgi:hypothetical protein